MSALRNAAAVLRRFAADRPDLSVTEVAEALELPKSTASWLLKMMAEEGLLEVAGSSRRYRPGPVVIAAGQLFRSTSSLIGAADEFVAGLAEEFGHTGYISILDGADVLAVRMHPGSNALRVVTPIGTRLPAFATAVGRVLLAHTPEHELRALVPKALPSAAGQAPASVEELVERIATAREQGYAEADDEANPGVGTIAVAIADPAARETASACISFSLSTVTAPERARIRRKLIAGANEIGRRFGDAFWIARTLSPDHV